MVKVFVDEKVIRNGYSDLSDKPPVRDNKELVTLKGVLYERVNLLPIGTAIDKLLKPEGVAYLADPRRRLADQFLELAAENNFSITPFQRKYQGGSQTVAVNIYKMTRLETKGK